MFCHRCGTELPDDSQFCRKCGQSLNVGPTPKSPAQATPANPPTARRYPEAYEWYAKREREGRRRMKHATRLAVLLGLACSFLGMMTLTNHFGPTDAARIQAHDSQIAQQAATIRAHKGRLTEAEARIVAEADVTASLKAAGTDPSQAPKFFLVLSNHSATMVMFGIFLPTVLSLILRKQWYSSGLKMVLSARQTLASIDTECNTRKIAETDRKAQA